MKCLDCGHSEVYHFFGGCTGCDEGPDECIGFVE